MRRAMLTNGSNLSEEKCQYEWRGCIVPCVLISDHLCSKRIEAQLQEIEQKSEKKKLEVRAFAVCPIIIYPPALLNVTLFFQLVELQTEIQQSQKQDESGGPAASASPP